MQNDELVARQARKIANLEEIIDKNSKCWDEIYGLLYNIGGALNDNKLGYTNEQLRPFFKIAESLNDVMQQD